MQLLRRLRVPEKPALFAFWQVEDQVAVVPRAIHHRDRLREKFARGENPLLSQDTSQAAVDWDGEKRRAGTSAKCALMSTYVDDCTMDVKSGLASVLWSTIRLIFVSDDPAYVQRGAHESRDNHSKRVPGRDVTRVVP